MRPALVGALELRFEAAAAQVDLQLQIRPSFAQLLRQFEALNLRAIPDKHQVDLWPVARRSQSLLFAQHEDALLTHRPADAGGAGTAQLRHQPVVTSARAYRALCTERSGGPFEHRTRVVIQSTNQARLDMIL